MEYAEKGDLKSIIKDKIINGYQNISEETIWNWFTQIAAAVKYIHSKKIIHRDIKAENVFIKGDGTLKIGDFGISKLLEDSMDYAASGVGTPYYLSPEICQGLKYNCKSDIWMMGCLLYELSSLRKPFKTESIKELIKSITTKEPEPLDQILYTEGFRNIVSLMLKKQPEQRPNIEEIWIRIQICSKQQSTRSKTIDKNKLKIEVEDGEPEFNYCECKKISGSNLPQNKHTPISVNNNDYQNPIKVNNLHFIPGKLTTKEFHKYTPNNSKLEIQKIMKKMKISPMNTPTTNNEANTNRPTTCTNSTITTHSTPKGDEYQMSNSNKHVHKFNTGKNFKNGHYRHIFINISSIQSPEHNAVYKIENIEMVENIQFPSPMNNISKPIMTPTNYLNKIKISPKESLTQKEVPKTTKCCKKQSVMTTQENPMRTSLIKNFLIERYTKNKFDLMYESILLNNNKINDIMIKDIVGDDYKIAVNYLKYLTKMNPK